MSNSETIKSIKHQFMSFRNGIVSDTLRKSGMKYDIIFGLQLPQISEIARGLIPSMDLANDLWDDCKVRESRLLACWIFPKDEITIDKCIVLAQSLQTIEEADILCFRLLRFLPFAKDLEVMLKKSGNDITRYCATALRRNLDAM